MIRFKGILHEIEKTDLQRERVYKAEWEVFPQIECEKLEHFKTRRGFEGRLNRIAKSVTVTKLRQEFNLCPINWKIHVRGTPMIFTQTYFNVGEGTDTEIIQFPDKTVQLTVKGGPRYAISRAQIEPDGLALAHSRIVFEFSNDPRVLMLVLSDTKTQHLESWLKTVGIPVDHPTRVSFVIDELSDTGLLKDIFEGTPQKIETCPECYGTGFHKGFGAPCSKGCK